MSSTRDPPRRRAAGASTSGLPGPSTTRSGAIGRAGSRLGVRSSIAPSRSVRHASVVASRIDRAGAVSPTGSVSSIATTGTKRKERDFDSEAGVGDEVVGTNINVVVRCRGRNGREVQENSAVVVSTAGVKGTVVDLSMGPNALSNKTYSFDRVYSSAADQSMIFDDTVKPILDEVSRNRSTVGCCSTDPSYTWLDALGVQLHDFRLRPNRNRQDVHDDGRHAGVDGHTL